MKKMNGKPYFVGDKEAVTQYCHGCVEFANRVKQGDKKSRKLYASLMGKKLCLSKKGFIQIS